jgi:hypothetical protein
VVWFAAIALVRIGYVWAVVFGAESENVGFACGGRKGGELYLWSRGFYEEAVLWGIVKVVGHRADEAAA